MPNAFHALIFMCWMVPSQPQGPNQPPPPPYKSCVISQDDMTFADMGGCQQSISEGMQQLKTAPSFKEVESGELTVRGVCHYGPADLNVQKHQQGLVKLYEGVVGDDG